MIQQQINATANLDNFNYMAILKQQQDTITAQQATITALQQRGQQTYEGDNTLFGDFAKQWLDMRSNKVSPTTMAKNEWNVKNLLPSFESMPLTALNVKTVQHFFDVFSKNHQSSTIKLVKSVLSMIMNYANAQDLLKKNPMPFIEIKQGEEYHKRPLTKKEICALIVDTKDERLWILPHLFLGTGMRREEVLGLRWEDVNFSTHEIYVHEVYTQNSYSKPVVGKPKTKKSTRYVAISQELCDMLKKYQEQQFDKYGKRTFIIGQRHEDKRTTPATLRGIIYRWRDKTGIKDLVSHMFRHTYATLAKEAGIDEMTIARQLGHTTTKLLETVYIHQTSNKDQLECANVMGKVLYK
jgi:integrase